MELREHLFKNKISVLEFSKILECNRAYLSQIINGKKRKSLAKLIELTTKGEVTAKELLGD
jgi:transcriptional regulator with XRE-family HTH domain